MDKYGDCDFVTNGSEVLDAFSKAMKDKVPYKLICLDVMFLKADGMKTLEAIRESTP